MQRFTFDWLKRIILRPGLGSLRREHEHRIRLASLNYISNIVSQSLELRQILNSSIDSIIEIMNADAVLIFLLNKEVGELVLHAHRGVSDSFVSSD